MKRAAIAFAVAVLGLFVIAVPAEPGGILIVDAAAVRVARAKETFEPTGPDRFWTPTKRQAKDAYDALETALLDPNIPTYWPELAAQAELAKTLSRYRIRVAGETAQGDRDEAFFGAPGAKIIELSGICPEADQRHWQDPIFMISDGGPCYFRANYDPHTRRIMWFEFNSPG